MMKKIYFPIVLFGALLFCACEKENIDPLVEDQAQSQIEESALKGAKMHYVPFKGKFVQEQTSFIEVPGGAEIEMEGLGNVTHLGKTDLWVGQFWGGAFPNLEGDAEVVFTAANGDELWADLYAYNSIELDADFNPVFATVTGTGNFAGGTGRFLNAEGSYELSAYFDFITLKSEAFYTGEIMY
jgi:hypothetical protein